MVSAGGEGLREARWASMNSRIVAGAARACWCYLMIGAGLVVGRSALYMGGQVKLYPRGSPNGWDFPGNQ